MPGAATVLAAAALVVAASDVTPADAVRTVKRAVFADNAGSVNGIKASITPAPGRIVPLGADGRFSASVLPPGARGPRGSQGPAGTTGATGPVGPRGPSSARVRLAPHALLGTVQGVEKTVASLSNVEAGSYLVIFSGTGTARVASVRGYLICELRVNGVVVAGTSPIVGETAGAAGALSIALQFPVTRTAPFELAVTCSADQPSSGEGFRVYSPILTALKLDSITTG